MSSVSALERIFFECLQKVTPEERSAYLAQACAGDAELLRRLQKMLEAQGSDFLEQAAYAPEASSDRPGQRIGAYRLVEPVGEGGMGTVWRAEQIEPVQRQVALKLIKAGMDSRQVIARFEAERQALALMDHPNIARVLDAGADAAGRPYFVMDLFAGMPITRYCDERRLPLRQRLELFVPVCEAIQHAHQKGVIHRDIKPSNVLVALQDGRAVPKVIDFGIAKAIEPTLSERTGLTQPGGIVGSLEYMSPEQSARGAGEVDTRSDIYSLGVVLYELLTGSTPLSPRLLEQASLADLLRVIADEETPKPSTRLRDAGAATTTIAAQRSVERTRLAKMISGELDWIVIKALEKDRNRRYATAADLAQDVQRFLANEPVLAGPPSAAYRLRKFARRHRGSLAAASVLVAALLVAIGGVGWAMRDRAARESEADRVASDQRARVHARVRELLDAADRQMAAQAWLEALETVRQADAAVTSGGADETTTQRVHMLLQDLEFVERLDHIRSRMATWTSSGFDSAGAFREYGSAFREHGLDIESAPVEELTVRLETTPALAVPLAAGLEDLAWQCLAQKDLAACRRVLLVASAIDREPVRTSIRSARLKRDAAAAAELLSLAGTLDVRVHPPETILNLARVLRDEQPNAARSLLRAAQHAHPGDFWLAFELGGVLVDQGDFQAALPYHVAAVAIRPDSAAAHTNLSHVLHSLGEVDAAMASSQRAIELDPNLSMAHTNMARALLDQRKSAEALESLRTALALDPRSTMAWTGLGGLLLDSNHLEEAGEAFQRVIELDPKSVEGHAGASNVLRARGKLPEAIACARQAIAADSGKAGGHISLGNALAVSGELAAAGEAFRKAIEVEPKNAVATGNLGNVLSSSKEGAVRAEAIALCRKAVELDPGYAIGHYGLGNALLRDGQDDAAIAAYRRTVELVPTFAAAYFNLGQLLWKQRKLDEALTALRSFVALSPEDSDGWSLIGRVHKARNELAEAEAALQKVVGIDPANAAAQHTLAEVLMELGRRDESVAAYRRAAELEPGVAARHMLLGLALLRLQRFAEAEAAYRKAIEIEPKNSLPYGVLGDVLHFQGRDDEAALAYRSAIEFDADFGGAHQGLGGILRSQGKFAEAIVEMEHGVRLGPQVPDAAGDLAMLLATCPDAKLRNGDRAVELARKAIELEPGDAAHFRALGAALYCTGEWAQALAALQTASELDPDGRGFDLFFAAMAQRQSGDALAARASYDQGCEWLERTRSGDLDVQRAREEAASLLGIDIRPR